MKKILLLPITLILTSCDLSTFLSLPPLSNESVTSNIASESEDNSVTISTEDSATSQSTLITSDNHNYEPVDERYQPLGADKTNSEEYYEFWDSSSKIKLDLNINQTNIQRISENGKDKNSPSNDYYFPADLTLTMNGRDYAFPEVGVRMKGNTSRVDFAPEGTIEQAANFKISFNELWDDVVYEQFDLYKTWTSADAAYLERDDRTLFGMKKIDVKWNKSNDPAIMSQPFINRFFGSEVTGLLYIPRSTLGQIVMGPTNMGVYILNEVIDSTLIKRFIPDQTAVGDLYKATYNKTGPASLNLYDAVDVNGGVYTPKSNWIGKEDLVNYVYPPYEIKTNKSTTNHLGLINFLRAINESKYLSENEVENRLQNTIDISAFIRYAAAAYLVGNPDDLRNNFNNYYMYFDSGTSQVAFIPYDNDWALGIGIPESNFGGLQMAEISPLHTERHIGDQPYQSNPLYWYLIIEEASGDINWSNDYPLIKKYQDQYLLEVQRLFNLDVFSKANFQTLYNRYRVNYEGVGSDIDSNSSFEGVNTFNEYHNRLANSISV